VLILILAGQTKASLGDARLNISYRELLVNTIRLAKGSQEELEFRKDHRIKIRKEDA